MKNWTILFNFTRFKTPTEILWLSRKQENHAGDSGKVLSKETS